MPKLALIVNNSENIQATTMDIRSVMSNQDDCNSYKTPNKIGLIDGVSWYIYTGMCDHTGRIVAQRV